MNPQRKPDEKSDQISHQFVQIFTKIKVNLGPYLEWWPSWGTFALATVGAWIFFLSNATNHIYLDDSLITLHYVQNVLDGHGLVFNEGEKIMGYSNPAYMIILIIITHLGIPTIMAGNLTFIGLSFGIILGSGLLFWRTGFPETGPFICTLFMTSELYWLSMKGMETPLFVFCALMAFVFFDWKFIFTGAVFAALAGLSRPDGIVVPGLYTFIVLFLAWCKSNEEFSFRKALYVILLMAAIGMSWAAFAFIYYGNVLPMSVQAKSLHNIDQYRKLLYVIKTDYIMSFAKWYWAGLFLSLFVLLCKERRMVSYFLWGFLNLLLLFIGDAPFYHWYVIPAFLCFVFLSGFGLFYIVQLLLREELKYYLSPAIGIFVFCFGCYHFDWNGMKRSLIVSAEPGKALPGEVIADHAESDDIVLAGDIGFAGYFSGQYVLDSNGLVSPQAHSYIAESNNFGLVENFQPEWIFGSFSFSSTRFRNINYELFDGSGGYAVHKKREWKISELLEKSPELLKALQSNQKICFLDWPTVSQPIDQAVAYFESEYEPSHAILFLRTGALEELLDKPDYQLFKPVPEEEKYVRDFKLEKSMEYYRNQKDNLPMINIQEIQDWSKLYHWNFNEVNYPEYGARILEANASDPSMTILENLPEMPVTGIIIEYQFPNEDNVWRPSELFFANQPDSKIDGSLIVHQNLLNDGKKHTAYYDLNEASNQAADQITALRWDPVNLYQQAKVIPLNFYFVTQEQID